MQSELPHWQGWVRGAWAGTRRGHWQTWCGETWSGCQSKHRTTGLKGLHLAPNHAWSSSSLCFQILVSTNIAMLELEKQQKFLQYSPRSLWGTEYFPSLEEQPRRAAYLNKTMQMSGIRRLRGRTPAHCLNSACTAHDQFKTCLTLHKHKTIVSLFTVPLSVLHTAFASCLTSTLLSYQAKQEITDLWVQTPKPVWQLLGHSKTNPFSYNPWDTGQRLRWGETQDLSSIFTCDHNVNIQTPSRL